MYHNLIPIQEAITLLPDAVLVMDSTGIIVAANERIKIIFDFTPAELKGQDLGVLLPKRYRRAQKQHIQQYFNHPTSHSMEKSFQLFGLRKDGTECDLDIALAPVSVNGSIFVIASIRDVTDLMELERDLIRKNEQLGIINRELERLGYLIAHDLKSPLLNVHALIRLLKRDMTEEQRQHLALHIQAIDNTLHSMLNLISGISEYSRSAMAESKEEIVDLNQTIKDACTLIHFPSHVSLDIAPQLPVIVCNKTKLIQVFLNLISNAIKYNDKDKAIIAIKCTEKKDEIIISVSDNGPGVPPKYRSNIFNLFQKGPVQKEDSQGIGLAVVKKIINEKGGKITVEDSPLGGAEFIITLPIDLKRVTRADSKARVAPETNNPA